MYDDYYKYNMNIPRMSYFEWLVGILAANCDFRAFNHTEDMVKYSIRSAKAIIRAIEKEEQENDGFSVKIPIAEMNAKKLGEVIQHSFSKRTLFLLCPNEQAVLHLISDNEISELFFRSGFIIENRLESVKSGIIGRFLNTQIIYAPSEENVFICCSGIEVLHTNIPISRNNWGNASEIVKKVDNLLQEKIAKDNTKKEM